MRRGRRGIWLCYLMNLADDLQKWLAQGRVSEVLPQVIVELREIAEALDTGAPISPITAIPPSSPPDTPRLLAARRSGARLGRRDPLLITRSLFNLTQHQLREAPEATKPRTGLGVRCWFVSVALSCGE